MTTTIKIFLGFWFLFSLLFFAHYFLVGQAVYGDARYYYSYSHALSFRGTLDIKPELSHAWTPASNNSFTSIESKPEPYPIQTLGPAIIWTIPIFITKTVLGITPSLSILLPNNGYSDIFQIVTGMFTTAISSLAICLLYSILSHRIKGKFINLVLLSSLVLSTNLIFYLGIDTLNTHFWSFSLSVIFFYFFVKYKKDQNKIAPLLGSIVGLAVQNRNHDLLTFLPFVFYLFLKQPNLKARLVYILKFSIIFSLTQIPQLYVNYIQFGKFSPPMASASLWSLNLSHIVGVLFAYPKGLIFTSTSVLICILLILKNKDVFSRLSLIAFTLQLLLIGSWFAWDQGESYGIRMLISTFPPLLISLSRFNFKAYHNKTIYFVCTLLILFNLTNIFLTMLHRPGANPATLQKIEKLFQLRDL